MFFLFFPDKQVRESLLAGIPDIFTKVKSDDENNLSHSLLRHLLEVVVLALSDTEVRFKKIYFKITLINVVFFPSFFAPIIYTSGMQQSVSNGNMSVKKTIFGHTND